MEAEKLREGDPDERIELEGNLEIKGLSDEKEDRSEKGKDGGRPESWQPLHGATHVYRV
jgi:hypothetical protein